MLSAKFPTFGYYLRFSDGDRLFRVFRKVPPGFEQFHVEIMRFHEQRMFVNDQETFWRSGIDVWVYKVENFRLFYTNNTQWSKISKKTSVFNHLLDFKWTKTGRSTRKSTRAQNVLIGLGTAVWTIDFCVTCWLTVYNLSTQKNPQRRFSSLIISNNWTDAWKLQTNFSWSALSCNYGR